MELSRSQLFSPHTDPDTGLTVYLLTEKVAPLQQSFYFVNSGMTEDARFLWFYCGFPPSPTRVLGMADLESETVRCFPRTQFSNASPCIDEGSGEAFWCARESVWRIKPEPDAEPELVNSLPEEMVGYRTVHRLATHLTRSCDGSEFFIDAALGVQWVMGSLPVDGGDFQLWHRFDRNYNHAQFSPHDPDLVLFAEENHSDPITGLRFPIEDRMWLIRRGERPRPIFDTPTRVSHEWWDADGQHVWCVCGNETWRTNIETRAVEKTLWPYHSWHAHNSRDGRYLVCDSSKVFYRGCPSTVNFLNRETDKRLQIVSNPEMPGLTGAKYHIDPHPRFCCDDRFVVFTTTVRGEVDVAIAETAELIDRTL